MSIEVAYAADNAPAHSHNGRQHSHPLPASGLNHQHGGKQKIQPSVKKQSEGQTATPSIEETERFLQHTVKTALAKNFRQENKSGTVVYDVQFDGPKITVTRAMYWTKDERERHNTWQIIGDLRQLSSIEFVAFDRPGLVKKNYGCDFSTLNLVSKNVLFDWNFADNKDNVFKTKSKQPNIFFHYCEEQKQNVKRISKAFKHLIAQYGVDVKIIEYESAGSAFD